jgi:hypothetical protein
MNNLGGNCLTDVRLLQALDEELPRRQAWLVKLHLEACESCQARLEEFRLLSSRVAELHQFALPSEPAGRFAAQLTNEQSREQPIPAWRRWFARPLPLRQKLACCVAFTLMVLVGLRILTSHPRAAVRQIALTRTPAVAPPGTREFVNEMPAPRVRHSRLSVKKSVPQQHISSQSPAVVREVATPFFALPFSDSALPLDQATMIRVELPRSALELAGLPVEEDRRNQRVRADLVLGVDGLARAIRFVE